MSELQQPGGISMKQSTHSAMYWLHVHPDRQLFLAPPSPPTVDLSVTVMIVLHFNLFLMLRVCSLLPQIVLVKESFHQQLFCDKSREQNQADVVIVAHNSTFCLQMTPLSKLWQHRVQRKWLFQFCTNTWTLASLYKRLVCFCYNSTLFTSG